MNGVFVVIFGLGGKVMMFVLMSEMYVYDVLMEVCVMVLLMMLVMVFVNGVMIVSENMLGVMLACGAYVDCGSAREDASWKCGFLYVLECVVFRVMKY